MNEKKLNPEGIEYTFATHVLGPFLMTEYLIPALEKAAPSRVITVTSAGMYPFKMSTDYQNAEGIFDRYASYGRAKRTQHYLTQYWSEKYAGKGITFNTVHPGWAKTPGTVISLPHWFNKLNLRTPEEGADSIVWLAVFPGLKEQTGKLWFDREPQRTHISLSRTRSTEEDVRNMYEYCSRFLERIEQ